MEITLDIGEDVMDSLDKIINLREESKPKSRTVTAVEMMTIGIKYTLMSLTEKVDDKSDPMYQAVLHNNELLMEILASTFSRDKSRVGAYDSESAVHMTKQLARKYLEGAGQI